MDLNHRPHAYQACALTKAELQARDCGVSVRVKRPGVNRGAEASPDHQNYRLFKEQTLDPSKPNSDVT